MLACVLPCEVGFESWFLVSVYGVPAENRSVQILGVQLGKPYLD